MLIQVFIIQYSVKDNSNLLNFHKIRCSRSLPAFIDVKMDSGVDILLLPMDLKDAQAETFYDDYIAGIGAKVASGEIS